MVEVYIPTHYGERKLVDWALFSRDAGGGHSRLTHEVKTREDAIELYDRVMDGKTGYRKPTLGEAMLLACPTYKYEGAVMNPYVVDWDECFIPEKWKQKGKLVSEKHSWGEDSYYALAGR